MGIKGGDSYSKNKMSLKIWKDRNGNKITFKEFKSRFKEGISLITPIQKMKNEVRGNFTMLVGYVVGLIALIIKFNLIPNKLLTIGLIIIFLGAAWSNGIKWIAMRQQLKLFKNLDTNAIDLNSVLNNLDSIGKEEIIISENEQMKGGNKRCQVE